MEPQQQHGEHEPGGVTRQVEYAGCDGCGGTASGLSRKTGGSPQRTCDDRAQHRPTMGGQRSPRRIGANQIESKCAVRQGRCSMAVRGKVHRSGTLACTSAGQHNGDRLEHDQQVEEQGVILDVVQIVLELLLCVLDRSPVVEPDLRPAGYAGLDTVPH